MPGATLAEAEALAVQAGTALRGGGDRRDVLVGRGSDASSSPGGRPSSCVPPTSPSTRRSGAAATACARLRRPSRARRSGRGRCARASRRRRAGGLLDEVLGWLDGDARALPAARRVQGVAELAADALDASAWSVSAVGDDGETLRTVAHTDRRVAPDVRVVRQREAFHLADYPATRSAVRGGGFHVHVRDADADSAEAVLLRRARRTQVLAGGASGRLVELFGDDATPPMGWASAPLRLLVREATTAAPSA